MGVTALVSRTTSAIARDTPGIPEIFTSQDPMQNITLAGIILTVSLVYLLAYLNLLQASEGHDSLRAALKSSIVPLALAFLGIVAHQSLAALQLL